MFKKLVTAILIFAAATTSIAFAKPYVGASIGATNLGVHSSGTSHAGVMGKVFGGNGDLFGQNQNIYIGGELNLDLATYPHYSGTYYGAGVSFIPGIMLTNYTMAYGRIGFELDRASNSSTTYFGNQLGFGIQTRLTNQWDVRGEYIHTANRSNSQLNLGLVYNLG